MAACFKCHYYENTKTASYHSGTMASDVSRESRAVIRVKKEYEAIKARLDRIDLEISKREIEDIRIILDRIDRELTK